MPTETTCPQFPNWGDQWFRIIQSTIYDFVAQLEPRHFIRVHRRFSVNTHFIEDIFPNELSLRTIRLPIGKSYRDTLLQVLDIKADAWIFPKFTSFIPPQPCSSLFFALTLVTSHFWRRYGLARSG